MTPDTNTNGTQSAEIQRFNPALGGEYCDTYPEMEEDPNGDFVNYADHLAAITAAEQRGWERARKAAAQVAGYRKHQCFDEWQLGASYSAKEIEREIRALAFPPASGSEAKEEEQ